MGCGGNIVTFTSATDYPAWQAAYPELAYIPYAVVNNWFTVAGTLYLRNDGSAPISTYAAQQLLLWMLTAHLLALFGPQPTTGLPPGATPANPTGGIVGRISTATEGSVTVTAEYAAATSQSAAFYQQTRYGAAYWDAIKSYRTFRYIPGPTRFFGARGCAGGGWW